MSSYVQTIYVIMPIPCRAPSLSAVDRFSQDRSPFETSRISVFGYNLHNSTMSEGKPKGIEDQKCATTVLELQKRKRSLCSTCDRPEPMACICSALPEQRIRLEKCHCLILQHPHERRHKNRSLPFVQMCLHPSSMSVSVARRFGTSTDSSLTVNEMAKEESPTWLVYPDRQAIPLTEALQTLSQNSESPKVTLVFLDATWKYAKEMHKANEEKMQYPSHMLRVKLSPDDFAVFNPRRFDIRTPPSEDCLSTAECLAFIISKLEKEPFIYDTIMKPLDLMVQQWHAFAKQTRARKRRKKEHHGELFSANA